MLPVRQPGYDDALGVGHDSVEAFGNCRRVLVELGAHVARLNGRRDALALDVLDVFGDPIDQLVTVLLEVLGSHRATVLPGGYGSGWFAASRARTPRAMRQPMNPMPAASAMNTR